MQQKSAQQNEYICYYINEKFLTYVSLFNIPHSGLEKPHIFLWSIIINLHSNLGFQA